MTTPLTRRIRDDRIIATANPRDAAPAYTVGMDDMDWWDVTLTMDGRKLRIPFGMGTGHNGKEPTAYDVLTCLLSDASSTYNARDFEDWAGDYGYDPDSRSAERTYRQVVKQTENLHRFLGDKFEAYIWDTEED